MFGKVREEGWEIWELGKKQKWREKDFEKVGLAGKGERERRREWRKKEENGKRREWQEREVSG